MFSGPINSAASQYGVSANILHNMMMAESSGDPNAHNSSSGASGLMQFMPDTAQQYGVDTSDPTSSINGAAHYMSDLLHEFGGDYAKAVAAYNWGPGNVSMASKMYGADWLSHAPGETRTYVSKIVG